MTRMPRMPSLDDITRVMNPTGGNHTPPPWAKVEYTAVNELMAHAPVYAISADGRTIAEFLRKEDRDLALFFVNAHPGIVSILRGFKGAWQFAAMASTEAGVKDFAANQAEAAEAWEQFFTTMGRSAAQQAHIDEMKPKP